jgi:inhibitor of cysteine peptidase
MNSNFVKRIWFESVLLCLTLSACSSPGATSDVRTLTEKDSGSQIELIVGQDLQVSLEGNPTTGYTWEVGEAGTGVIAQVGEMEYQSDSSAVGAGGLMTFRFHAAEAGQTKLRLVYHRPFEKDTPPLKTFEVTITVFVK